MYDGTRGKQLLPLTPGSLTEMPLLLKNKLRIPRPRPNLVPRPRLVKKLDAALQKPLTSLSAPAGFGKTALLTEWVAQCTCHVAWVSLDPGDNVPIQFWAYVTAALQKLNNTRGEGLLFLLQPLDERHTELFLSALLNQVSDLSEEAVLILDDYHVIESSLIHDGMTFLIEHLPPQLHVVIASRAVPPVATARLRARVQLLEFSKDDLGFTLDEASEFFHRAGILNLSSQNLARLNARTEGWVAGLQLVALSAERQPNLARIVEALTGSNRYIADYLTEEVLQHQSPEKQDFLLKTSILDHFSVPLCDAVLADGARRSRRLLEELDRANMFVVTLDDERIWYRYHHLFTEVLRNKLSDTYPELIPTLYYRAGAWYEQNGFWAEAVQMALAGSNLQHAADLIEARCDSMVAGSDTGALLTWLQALPVDLVLSRPRLCVAKAWALFPLGRYEDAEECLQAAEGTIQARPRDPADCTATSIRGEVAAVRAMIASTQHDALKIIAFSKLALDLLTKERIFLRGVVSLSLGLAYTLLGDFPAARRALSEAAALPVAGGNLLLIYLGHYYLAVVADREGKLHEASEILHEALQIATSATGEELPIASLAHIGLASLFYEWNDLEAARRHINRGLELGVRWWVPDVIIGAYLTLACIEQARGDLEAAHSAYKQVTDSSYDKLTYPFISHLAISNTRSWMKWGSMDGAFRWAEDLRRSVDLKSDLTQQQYDVTVAAHLLVVEGKLEQARPLLESLIALDEVHGYKRQLIENLVVEALLLYAQKRTSQAMVLPEPCFDPGPG